MDLPEIVDGNFWVLTDNFVLVVHVSCGKVDQDVDYEHYINNKLYNDDWVVKTLYIIQVHFLPLHFFVIQFQVKDGDEGLKVKTS